MIPARITACLAGVERLTGVPSIRAAALRVFGHFSSMNAVQASFPEVAAMKKALLIAGLLVLFPTSVFADDTESWIGQKVFYKEGAKAVNDGQEVDLDLVPFPATVEDVNGDSLWVGKAWVKTGDVYTIDQAFDHYSEQIQNDPSASAYHKRAMVWRSKGNFDNAIKDCDEAIKLDPLSASAYRSRGSAH